MSDHESGVPVEAAEQAPLVGNEEEDVANDETAESQSDIPDEKTAESESTQPSPPQLDAVPGIQNHVSEGPQHETGEEPKTKPRKAAKRKKKETDDEEESVPKKKKPPRQHSAASREGTDNITLPLEGQTEWSIDNMPEILYVFRPTTRQPRNYPKMAEKASPYPGERVLRDFKILPDRISSNVEEFRVEAWMRYDRRIQLHDITDRMHPSFRVSNNTLQQRGVRFRQAFKMMAWGSGSRKTQEMEAEIEKEMTTKGIDPKLNSTRGLTPGLIDPCAGEYGGRVPVPEQYKKRYVTNSEKVTISSGTNSASSNVATEIVPTDLGIEPARGAATNTNPHGISGYLLPTGGGLRRTSPDDTGAHGSKTDPNKDPKDRKGQSEETSLAAVQDAAARGHESDDGTGAHGSETESNKDPKDRKGPSEEIPFAAAQDATARGHEFSDDDHATTEGLENSETDEEAYVPPQEGADNSIVSVDGLYDAGSSTLSAGDEFQPGHAFLLPGESFDGITMDDLDAIYGDADFGDFGFRPQLVHDSPPLPPLHIDTQVSNDQPLLYGYSHENMSNDFDAWANFGLDGDWLVQMETANTRAGMEVYRQMTQAYAYQREYDVDMAYVIQSRINSYIDDGYY